MKIFDKVKKYASEAKAGLIAGATASVATIAGLGGAFAEGEVANSALVTGLTSTASSITADITAILPIALGIFAAIFAITFGIKIFKRVSKAG